MPPAAHTRTDLHKIRCDLAAVAVPVAFLRIERALSRKYSPDQPREPAGQPGGGRWASEDGATGSLGEGGSSEGFGTENVVTDDGSRVLTLRIRSSNAYDGDTQHIVVAPDGTRTLFETSGWTQTVRDGETGDILGRSTLTRSGVQPEAFFQSVRSGRSLQQGIARAIEAAVTLFTALSKRNSRDGTAIFAAPASEYVPNQDRTLPPIWVGRIDQADLDAACPRNGEVQAILDAAAAAVKASGNYTSPQDFGNKVHAMSAGTVRSMRDPNFIAETSYVPNPKGDNRYGARGTLRLDLLEQSVPLTVCIYDHKTGDRGLTPRRAVDLAAIVQHHFPGTQRIIVNEVRPRP